MRLLFLLSALLVSCSAPDPSGAELASVASEARAHWEATAPRCNGDPSLADCEDGDMTLIAGLLCASGRAEGCDMVRRAQGPDGRWWRSPRRVGGNLGDGNSFSRDMAMGVFLYLVTTGDQAAGLRWYEWIKSKRQCTNSLPVVGCQTYKYRVCTDDTDGRCTMTPKTWALFARTFDRLGLDRKSQMRTDTAVEKTLLETEANVTPGGFEKHLKGVEVLLRQRLGGFDLAPATATLASQQPLNPFFRYLRDGKSDALSAYVTELCPKAGGPVGARDEWAWERADQSEAWRDASGWECIFLANLLQ